MVKAKGPVKVTIGGVEHDCDGVTIDSVTYAPFTVYDETHDITDAKQIAEMVAEITCDIVYNQPELERLRSMSSRAITGSTYQRTKPFKSVDPKPLHYTFYQQPNGNGMNRVMYRHGMRWSEEYKETKRRVKQVALPHRIKRTVLHFMARVRRALRDNKGLLPG